MKEERRNNKKRRRKRKKKEEKEKKRGGILGFVRFISLVWTTVLGVGQSPLSHTHTHHKTGSALQLRTWRTVAS